MYIKFNPTQVILSFFLFILSYYLFSCSVSKQISKQAKAILINDTAISNGHIGISIYEPASGKFWYNYQADKYFIPASNTKLFTLYAGMKYLGDSLPGLRYFDLNDTTTVIQSSGDPTFLHPGFPVQPVFSFLRQKNKIKHTFTDDIEFLGEGWAWDDYKEYYMVQRNDFPVYGNVISVKKINEDSVTVQPMIFSKSVTIMESLKKGFEIVKTWDNNKAFLLLNGNKLEANIPFRPDPITINELLEDTIKKKIEIDFTKYERNKFSVLFSRPSDALFKPMMQNSDNFFAEQTLLMASNERLGYMSDKIMIDTLLQTDLKDIPQRPRWVDGSGLSRYNLFTPHSIIYILNKMKNEFGLDRLKNIMPSGGMGSLKNYYIKDSSNIFAKTGTLSNNSALSGFLITKKGKLLIFSVLANNYLAGSSPVSRAFEHFLVGIREKY